LLDRLRGSLAAALESLGSGASKVVPNPTAWTLVGMLFAFFAFYCYATGLPAAAGLMVLFAGLFDVLDGAVARATARTSARGAFLDSTLDRVSELVIFLGILIGNYVGASFVLLALALSLLVSYTRAKGDALGVNLAGVGIGERSERLVVLIVSSLFSIVGLGVLLIALLAFVTFVQRTARVGRVLSQRSSSASPQPTTA